MCEIPSSVSDVLKEFLDVMPPPELPCELPPYRAINHQIELMLNYKPPARAPYQMAPLELVELLRQLTSLLDNGFIQPSKAPFGAPIFFQCKQDGSQRMCVGIIGH